MNLVETRPLHASELKVGHVVYRDGRGDGGAVTRVLRVPNHLLGKTFVWYGVRDLPVKYWDDHLMDVTRASSPEHDPPERTLS